MAYREANRLFMWAGGKSRMLPLYDQILSKDDRSLPYVEPFVGGAAMFNFLQADTGRRALISDLNAELIGLYELVRDDPEFLIDSMLKRQAAWLALSVPERKLMYYSVRADYWALDFGPEATALLYFLMRTGFNGIWQTCKASSGRFGTPVGLANQKAEIFNPATVRTWSQKLARADIRCCSYEAVELSERSFVFCDPPYRNSFTSYGVSFDDADQLKLIEWCRRLHQSSGSTVWLCNREAGDGFFETNAFDARLHRFPITYTAGRRKRTEEGFEAMPATELLMVWG